MEDKLEKQEHIIMYTTAWCGDCRRAKEFFAYHEIEYVNIDIDKEPRGAEFVKRVNNGNRSVPTIIFPDGTKMVEPSSWDLAEKLGVKFE